MLFRNIVIYVFFYRIIEIILIKTNMYNFVPTFLKSNKKKSLNLSHTNLHDHKNTVIMKEWECYKFETEEKKR